MTMPLVRFALRRALRRPGFSLVVVGLLAGAIAINATVFAVLNAVAFSKLPYPDADRLVDIRLAQRGCEYCARETVPAQMLAEWQRSVRSVETWGAMHSVFSGLVLTDTKREVRGEAITPATLTLLGARIHAGRVFADEDDVRGGPRRVILSHDLWQRQFASDDNLLGRFIRLNDDAFEVIGVLDRSFVWPDGDTPDLFVTQNAVSAEADKARVIILAKLAPGASIERLNAELARSGDAMIHQLLGRRGELRTSAIALSRSMALGRGIELAILQLLGLVVLGVACANVAGLLIARQQAERHLFGMRVVLGARMRDLITLPMLDVAPLVMTGAVIGLLIAARATPVASAILGTGVPAWADVRVDAIVVLVTLIAAAIASCAIAVAPVRELFRTDLRSWIQTGTLAAAGSKQARTRQQILVGAQIGISTTLLVTAGVLVLNLAQLGADTARLERQGRLRASFSVPEGRDARVVTEAVVARLRSEPGVIGAAFTASAATSIRPQSIAVDGGALTSSIRLIGIQVGARFAEPNQGAIAAGRDFTDDEIRAHTDNVVVINESMATLLWRNSAAVGRRVRVSESEPWRIVVGVRRNVAVGASSRVASDASKAPAVYWVPGLAAGSRNLALTIATGPDAERFIVQVGRALDEVAPNTVSMLLPDSGVLAARAEARVRTILLVVLACFALVMSVVGVGSLVAFSTGLRNREFGIRTAMGATALMIAGEVVRDALRMSGKGLLLAAVGTIGAYFAFIPMLYFNAKIFDWRIAAGAIVVMTLLIVAASVMPALRAAKLNPANVLRGD